MLNVAQHVYLHIRDVVSTSRACPVYAGVPSRLQNNTFTLDSTAFAGLCNQHDHTVKHALWSRTLLRERAIHDVIAHPRPRHVDAPEMGRYPTVVQQRADWAGK
jgi:hypothetical protein